jgi:hypothetical protein
MLGNNKLKAFSNTSKQSMNPNPQGKGLVPILHALAIKKEVIQQTESHTVSSAIYDYFIARLILCAKFNFKPVLNTPYYLYVKDEVLKLSLIAPNQWCHNEFGLYICQCTLELPLRWRIESRNDDNDIASKLRQVISSLQDTLLSDLFAKQPLGQSLPYCDERLPFHHRVLANALASQIENQIPTLLASSFKQLVQSYLPHKKLLGDLIQVAND